MTSDRQYSLGGSNEDDTCIPIPSICVSDPSSSEERELYRLATHIAQYDKALTETLVQIAKKRAEHRASVAG